MEKIYKMKRQRPWSLFLLLAMLLGLSPKLMAQEIPTSIQLDAYQLELYFTDMAQLTATVTPATASNDLRWESSDYSVVQVSSNGLVSAYNYLEKEASAIITVYSELDDSVKAECEVTVKPSFFWFDVTEITLPVGWVYQIWGGTSSRPFFQELPVAWEVTSGNENLLTVNGNKMITSTGQTGSCVLTGSYENESHSITVNVVSGVEGMVSYYSSPGYQEKMNSDLYMLEITGMDEENQLQAFLGGDFGCKLTWTSSDESVATVDQTGKVTFVNPDGYTTFTATAPNGVSGSWDYISESVGSIGQGGTVEGSTYFLPKLQDYYISWGSTPLNLKEGAYATVSFEGGEPLKVPLAIVHDSEEWPPYLLQFKLTEVAGLTGAVGNYQLTLPAATVSNDEGAINETQSIGFIIVPIKEATYTITPEPGDVKPYQLSPLSINIGGGYQLGGYNYDYKKPYLNRGSALWWNNIYPSSMNYNNNQIDFNLTENGIDREGTYTFVIPEGTIVQYNPSTEEYSLCPELSYTYTVLPGMPDAELVSPLGKDQPASAMSEVKITWPVETTLTLVNDPENRLDVFIEDYNGGQRVYPSVTLTDNILTVDLSQYTFNPYWEVTINIPSGFIEDETGDKNQSQSFYFQVFALTSDNDYTVNHASGSELNLHQLSDILITWPEMDRVYFNEYASPAYILTQNNETIPLEINKNINLIYNAASEVFNRIQIDASDVEEGTFTIVIPENYLMVGWMETSYINSEIRLTYTVGGDIMEAIAEVTVPADYENAMKFPYLTEVWLSFGDEAEVTYYDTKGNYGEISYIYVDLEGNSSPGYTWASLYNTEGNYWVNPEDEEGNIYGNQLQIGLNWGNPGTYTLELPAGFLKDPNDALNKKQTFQFVITGPELPDYNVTPAAGQVESLETITISFGEDFSLYLQTWNSDEDITVTKDGKPLQLAYWGNPYLGEYEEEDGTTWPMYDYTKLEFSLVDEQEEAGVYEITIPADIINIYSYEEGWNAYYPEDINIEYVIPALVTSITLDPDDDQELEVGETLTVEATVLPEGATAATVVWTLSEEDVVSIEVSKENPNEVTVTALAEGETELLATAADGSGIFASITITVYENNPEPAPDLEFVTEYNIEILYNDDKMVNGVSVVWESEGELALNESNEIPVTALPINGTTNYTVETAVEENALVLDLSALPAGTYNVTIPEYYVLIGENATNEKITFQISIDVVSGIAGIQADADGNYRVYDLSGRNLMITRDASKVKDLENGLYIINGKKVMLRK